MRPLQDVDETRHPEIPEGERKEDEKHGAGADDAAVYPAGEPAPPRGDGRPDEEIPRRVGQDVPGEEGEDAPPSLPARKQQVPEADRRPPERPVRVRGRGDDTVDHGTHPP